MNRLLTKAGILTLALIAVACTGKKEDKQQAVEELPLVETVPVYAENVSLQTEYTATVEPFKTNNISSSTGNRIKRLNVDVGSRVSAGQALVVLDDVNVAQQEISLANQRRDLERARELVKIGGGTQQTVDQLQAQYDASARALRTLKENTVLTSPVSGVVTEKNYNAGDLPAGPILVIEQQNPLKVVVNVNESEMPHVSKGMTVPVKFDTYEGEIFQGQVYLIHPTVDEQTRTFQVEITINNSNGKLKTGMFARVNFNFGSHESIVVPDKAVIKQVGSGVRYVYVLQSDGTVRFQEVELGRRLEDRYEILSGLNQGDIVVTAGQSKLTDGARVKVKGK